MTEQQHQPQWHAQEEQQQQEGLFKSFYKGSKWLGKNVLPVLGLASGSAVAAGAGLATRQQLSDNKVDAPAAMPMPDEDEISRARKRSVAAQMGRSGRSSTILTGDRETLG